MDKLLKLSESIWVAEWPVKVMGFDLPTRMTVIRLSSGSLLIHSPVKLTPGLRKELKNLGPVKYVVSPNKQHHLFMGDFADFYPRARLYASPGLQEKRKDLRFYSVLREIPETEWADDIDQTIFHGNILYEEVIFFHKQSHSLILADLAFNFNEKSSGFAKITSKITKSFGYFGPGLGVRLLSQKLSARNCIEKVLDWDFDKIIIAHGDIITIDAREKLKEAFSFLNRKSDHC